jgi:hypothetical protein
LAGELLGNQRIKVTKRNEDRILLRSNLGCDDMNQIKLILNCDQWQALILVVVNLQVLRTDEYADWSGAQADKCTAVPKVTGRP